ncbi:MAG: cytochrome C, partial [Deltaproteobacteria bacterium]|nr:cytochrome C [Deltaproteobacteria bacterium]
MKSLLKWSLFLTVLFLVTGGVLHFASADHDKEERRQRHRNRDRIHSEDYARGALKPVDNPTFQDECGSCHFAYQPALLPSGSWDRILN